MEPSVNASTLELRLLEEDVARFLDDAFPATARASLGRVKTLAVNRLRMRLDPDASMIRSGKIASGAALIHA